MGDLLGRLLLKLAGKTAGGWILGHAKLIGIAMLVLSVLSIVGAVTIYAAGAERAKAERDALQREDAAQIATILAQAEQIDALNERIRANNRRLLEQIAAETSRVEQARQAAEQMREQRDRLTAELADSHRKWREEIDDDPSLREWLAQPVPGAVWDRLRAATGDDAAR